MATTAIDSLRGILNGFRDLNSKGIYTMNATETDLLRQILIEVQALSIGGGIADGSVTTPKLVDGAVTTPKLVDGAVTELKLADSFKQTLFNKNELKNPNFAVIQGTASGTLANSLALPTASLGYQGETEWCIAANGGTPAYVFSALDERVTFTGAASTTAIYLLQRLESRDTNRLKGKTVTFSCEISNSLLTSVIWEVFRPTTSDDVHGTIASPTQTLIASGTFTVTSTLTRYSATFALPDLASRGLEVRLRVGAQTSGTWVVSRLQLEEGSVATDFNCGGYPSELQVCKRYYEASTYYESAYNISGMSWLKDVLFTEEKFISSGILLSNETYGGFSGLISILSTNKKFNYQTDVSANNGQHVVSFTWQAFSHIP